MSIWNRTVNLRWPTLMAALYLVLTAGLFIAYLYFDISKKWEPLVTGSVTGAFFALIQFFWSWAEANGAGKLKELKVQNVLLTRDDAGYYGQMIGKSSVTIDVMGVTAKRFLEDFADTNSPRADKRVLSDALGRGVKVRILVASERGLSGDKSSVQKAASIVDTLKVLASEYKNFSYGYYDHEPAHSIVLIDDSCIVGPSFEGKPSQHTPAIQMEKSSPLARVYLEHFEKEWTAKKSAL